MNTDEPWTAITEDLLVELAGPAAYDRGLRYHRDDHVAQFEWVSDNTIRATVDGTTRYVTQLNVAGGVVDAACTCPVGERNEFCKHAVAVGLQLVDPGDEAPKPPPQCTKRGLPGRPCAANV